MHRRNAPMTTSSHEEKTKRKEDEKDETIGIHISFKRKDSKKLFFIKDKKDIKKKKREMRQQALKAKRQKSTEKRKQCILKPSIPGKRVMNAAAAAARSRLRLEVKSRRTRQHSLSYKRIQDR